MLAVVISGGKNINDSKNYSRVEHHNCTYESKSNKIIFEQNTCGVRAVRRACGAIVFVVAYFPAFCENIILKLLFAFVSHAGNTFVSHAFVFSHFCFSRFCFVSHTAFRWKHVFAVSMVLRSTYTLYACI